MIYDSPDSKHVSYIQTNRNVSQFTDQRLNVTFDYMGNIEDMVKILNYNPCLGQNYANSTSSKKCQMYSQYMWGNDPLTGNNGCIYGR